MAYRLGQEQPPRQARNPAPRRANRPAQERPTMICRKCRQAKSEEDFHARRATCKECRNADRRVRHDANRQRSRDISRAWYAANRERGIELSQAWRQAHPEIILEYARKRAGTPAVKARKKLNNAVRRGKISKPAVCETCDTEAPVQAHHPDYSKPFDVHWLCTSCHGLEHRA